MLKPVLAAIALVAVTAGSAGAQERATDGSLVIAATTSIEDSPVRAYRPAFHRQDRDHDPRGFTRVRRRADDR